MDNEVLPEEAIRRARAYLEQKKLGLSKAQSARNAGYSNSTANVPKAIESTRSYALVLNEMLDKNSEILYKVADSIQTELEEDGLTTKNVKTLKDKAFLMKTVAETHKILTPQVTVKKEEMKDGTTKTTTWGSVGATMPVERIEEPES